MVNEISKFLGLISKYIGVDKVLLTPINFFKALLIPFFIWWYGIYEFLNEMKFFGGSVVSVLLAGLLSVLAIKSFSFLVTWTWLSALVPLGYLLFMKFRMNLILVLVIMGAYFLFNLIAIDFIAEMTFK
ncbi:MAG: hypothetical protein J4428_04720 [Candidatus Aenigmarchaeota archaeon]|nr:hypothetical protein [Candidatus Aenigmarchaeota archaeon]